MTHLERYETSTKYYILLLFYLYIAYYYKDKLEFVEILIRPLKYLN